MEDASRITQKFLLGRGDISDLSSLHATITAWTAVRRRMELERTMEQQERGTIQVEDWSSVTALMARLNDMQALAKRIGLAVHLNSTTASTSDELETPEEDSEEDIAEDVSLSPPPKSKHSFSFNNMDWAIKSRYSI